MNKEKNTNKEKSINTNINEQEVNLEIVTDKNKKITVIKNLEFFDLIKTLDSGQTFRYEKVFNDDNNVIGAYVCSRDNVTYMEMKDSEITTTTTTKNKTKSRTTDLYIYDTDKKVIDYWIDFFNLKKDYLKINKEIIKINKDMKKIIEHSSGVRIIHMDLWESMLTFIISANNNMGRIKSSVNLLSERYGRMIKDCGSVKFYEIPRPDEVIKLSLEEVRDLKVGFRDKYILDAAEKITNKELVLENFDHMSSAEAKEELMKVKGIGDKVADCIRLFALNKVDSFPVDVWIERYMLMFDLKESIEKENKKYSRIDIEKYAEEKYKKLAGYAQQYIFYYCISKLKNEIKEENDTKK